MTKTQLKNVLLIDGAAMSRKLLAVRLSSIDLNPVEAGSAEELNKLTGPGRSFDLVVSEQALEGMEKAELLQKLRDLGCPVLIFTDQPVDEAQEKPSCVKGIFHKSQRNELLKAVVVALGAVPMKEMREVERHILVIEDSPTIRNFLRRILEKSFPGSVIREASDGREALSEMSNKKVDFILTDLQMPGMDGHAFLRMLHSNPILKHKPVVVLSSSITSELREQVKGFEKVRLLAKPSSAEEISKTLGELMVLSAAI
jgi:two-component system chemotaxis response regulator CheY